MGPRNTTEEGDGPHETSRVGGQGKFRTECAGKVSLYGGQEDKVYRGRVRS